MDGPIRGLTHAKNPDFSNLESLTPPRHYFEGGAFSTNFGWSKYFFADAGRSPTLDVVQLLVHRLLRLMQPLPHGLDRSGWQYIAADAC